jgi:hypothetical protein
VAGFNTVDIGLLSITTLLFFIIMMRIKTQMYCSLGKMFNKILDEKTDIFEKIAKDEENLILIQKYSNELKNENNHYFNSVEDYNQKNFNIIENLQGNPLQYFKKYFENRKKTFNNLFFELKLETKNMNFWLMIVILLMTVIEHDKLKNDKINFNILKIVFE